MSGHTTVRDARPPPHSAAPGNGPDASLLWRAAFPAPVAVLCVLIFISQVALVGDLLRQASTPRLQSVPVEIVSAPVVSQVLVEKADAMPGRPFAASQAVSQRAARGHVRGGGAVAALLVDLRGTRDVLVVNDARDPRLNEAVVDRITAIEDGYGRVLDVDHVRAPGVTGAEADIATPGVYNLTLLAGLLGFLLVVAVSILRGPVARSLRVGVRRVVAIAGISLLTGLLLTTAASVVPGLVVPGVSWRLSGVSALAVLLPAMLTLALEGVIGLAGLGLSAIFLGVVAVPLLTRTDAYLLPIAWHTMLPWTPPGASLDAISGVTIFGGAGLMRPLLVIGVWLVVAVVALLVARRTRGRATQSLAAASRLSGGWWRPGPRVAGEPVAWGFHPTLWRLRVAVVVAPLLVALLVAVALVPEGDVATASPQVSRASETTCLSTGKVRTVADLNRIAEDVRGAPEFQGGDVGADVLLQDGRRLWVFGDTIRAADFDGQMLVRNSMLVLGPDCIAVVLPVDHGALIPDRHDGALPEDRVGYWPMSIGRIGRPGYDLVPVATQRVRSTGTGVFDFENLGTSIALFVVPWGGTPQLLTQRDIGPDDPDGARPTWGAASVVYDGWVYLYGTSRPSEAQGLGFSLRVARVRPEDLLVSSRWQYWDGVRWTRSADSSEELIPAAGGVSQTLSVFQQEGKWYALSKRNEFLGTELTVWTAPSPEGPFGDPRVLALLPSDTITGQLRYMPLAHPDLLPHEGTVVVSYSRNDTDFGEVLANPLLYRPRFLRVTLP